jgi:hypothetical protein
MRSMKMIAPILLVGGWMLFSVEDAQAGLFCHHGGYSYASYSGPAPAPASYGLSTYGYGVNPYAYGVNPYGYGVNPYGYGINPYAYGVTPYGYGVSPYGSGVSPYGLGWTDIINLVGRLAAGLGQSGGLNQFPGGGLGQLPGGGLGQLPGGGTRPVIEVIVHQGDPVGSNSDLETRVKNLETKVNGIDDKLDQIATAIQGLKKP